VTGERSSTGTQTGYRPWPATHCSNAEQSSTVRQVSPVAVGPSSAGAVGFGRSSEGPPDAEGPKSELSAAQPAAKAIKEHMKLIESAQRMSSMYTGTSVVIKYYNMHEMRSLSCAAAHFMKWTSSPNG